MNGLVACTVSLFLNSHSGDQTEPEPTARAKYSSSGGFSHESFAGFGFTPAIVKALSDAANHSVAGPTWASYATAERHIARAEKHTGVRITFPFSLKALLAYVGFLLCGQLLPSTRCLTSMNRFGFKSLGGLDQQRDVNWFCVEIKFNFTNHGFVINSSSGRFPQLSSHQIPPEPLANHSGVFQ